MSTPDDDKRRRRSPALAPVPTEESVPVYVLPGTPPPPPGSRIRHYTTAQDYAEADQRRLERLVDRAVAPVMRDVEALAARLESHMEWAREVEASKHEERVRVEVALKALQDAATVTAEARKRRVGVAEGAIITAIITAAVAALIARGGL